MESRRHCLKEARACGDEGIHMSQLPRLMSRFAADDEKEGDMKKDAAPQLPKEDRHRSHMLRSRLLTESEDSPPSPTKVKGEPSIYREHGEDRPLTVVNIFLAFQMVAHLWRNIYTSFGRNNNDESRLSLRF